MLEPQRCAAENAADTVRLALVQRGPERVVLGESDRRVVRNQLTDRRGFDLLFGQRCVLGSQAARLTPGRRPRDNEGVARFVIDSGATLHLAGATVSAEHELLVPTPWLCETTLAALHEAVRRDELAADVARERIARMNALQIRLLGDAVLRRRAWGLAFELGLDTTYPTEYVALAQLQKGTS